MAVNMTPLAVPMSNWTPGIDGMVRGSDPSGLLGGGLPLAPTGFTVTYLSDTSLTLAWTDNATDETGYEIDRSLTGTGGWTNVTTTAANVATYANTGLAVDTTYYYRVRAVNGTGNSAYALANGLTTAVTGNSAVVFSSFVFETNAADTTISITVERHPDLDLNLDGTSSVRVDASNGFNSAGRYTALSQTLSWTSGDVADKTATLTIPAQTLDGPFEVNLDLVPLTGCTVRKWEEGTALARVDDGSVYSLAYHISPDDVNAADTLDAGTASKPTLSGYYLFQNIIRTHPDITKPVMVYFHAGNHTDSGSAPPWGSKYGYYPEIDGTREHPIKIQNYPGDTVDLTNSIGFLIEDRQHLHIKGFTTGPHDNTIDHWADDSANFIILEDFIGSGRRAATGAVNYATFRIDYTGNAVIRNCNITDFKLDNGSYNANLAPILSYGAYNVLVERCYFNDAAVGIKMKIPPTGDTLGEQGWTIRKNEFGPLLEERIGWTNGAGWGGGHFDSVMMYQNLMHGGGSGLERISYSADLVQDEAIIASTLPSQFYNNTLVDIGDYDWSGHLISHYNNAYRSTASRLLVNVPYDSKIGAAGSIINYSDYNLSNVISATIKSAGPVTEDYATKTAWNAAVVGSRLLTANPDSNSYLETATFTNEGGGDYTITNANASGSGLANLDIGAKSSVGLE